ncbi:putative prolyl oligopeptidase protein [Phaeoacremonium minimum UCRPA7]|uniref:Prolyl endopeptidase n=1 Tax=Phaeoacremonium minimum (strain UCR-PA7) TaxID=1286976 RepID=R8BKY0_PHAM7|nr:putative prolyl oligopeptidase protein [Phaeoacremonium minimum UCRPA7]EON99944.1 putative prolyl oligopeptidase protein [Phaeoacremonium minimum UCRPA7]
MPQKMIVEERLRSLVETDVNPPDRWIASQLFRLRKSASNTHGVLEYAERKPDGSHGEWQVVIDIAELSHTENKKYVFVDFDIQSRVLGPDASRILLYLSDGGSDLVSLVEVDVKKGGLVPGGFRADPDRLAAAWLDKDHILIQQSLTNGLKTVAGMPRTAFIWKRGTDLQDAKAVYTAPATDAISLVTSVGPTENGRALITRAVDYTTWIHYAVFLDGTVEELRLPSKQCLLVPPRTTSEHLVVSLVEKAVIRGVEVPGGSIVACSIDPDVPVDERASVVYVPEEGEFTPNIVADGLQASQSRVQLTVTKNGKERRLIMEHHNQTWKLVRSVPTAPGSHISLTSGDYYSNDFIMSESGLLHPIVSWLERADGRRDEFYAQPAAFDASGFTLDVQVANSKDGTPVDYVVLAPKESKHQPGELPVLITGYGVMGISILTRYLEPMFGGISLVPWLESGGALVVALIRGGGERGPDWHKDAQREKRQNSYDDFIAISEKLIKDGVTTSKHLGVFGVSGGGLLAAVVGIQRPDLYGAVVSDVPITDMLRYPTMGMGGAWMREFGDPKDPKMAKALRGYSPFHNVKEGVEYPPFLVTVSTKDDRVGVGHSRKLVAKMKDAGVSNVFLYEDEDGGHNVSDPFKNAGMMSRRVTFLIDSLQ